jgi:fucose permease
MKKYEFFKILLSENIRFVFLQTCKQNLNASLKPHFQNIFTREEENVSDFFYFFYFKKMSMVVIVLTQTTCYGGEGVRGFGQR